MVQLLLPKVEWALFSQQGTDRLTAKLAFEPSQLKFVGGLPSSMIADALVEMAFMEYTRQRPPSGGDAQEAYNWYQRAGLLRAWREHEVLPDELFQPPDPVQFELAFEVNLANVDMNLQEQYRQMFLDALQEVPPNPLILSIAAQFYAEKAPESGKAELWQVGGQLILGLIGQGDGSMPGRGDLYLVAGALGGTS
jgi:hypothetical protein